MSSRSLLSGRALTLTPAFSPTFWERFLARMLLRTPSPAQLVLSLSATAGAYVLYRVARVFGHSFVTRLRLVRGPRANSLWLGNMREVLAGDPLAAYEKWAEEYGATFKFKGLFLEDWLVTTDLKALNHILVRSDIYEKPDLTRKNLELFFGKGLLVAEGEDHKRQRKIVNPAFGPTQLRELTGIFLDKANELRDVWVSDICAAGTPFVDGTPNEEKKTRPARINVLVWLSRCTLDIIGLAGFNTDFAALSTTKSAPHQLSAAFLKVFDTNKSSMLWNILIDLLPVLRLIPATARDRSLIDARRVMTRVGSELVQERKQAVRTEMRGQGEKAAQKGRDLLSLLVRANMATDVLESQRLSDADMMAQIPTFLVAGHETTSTGVTWALYALSRAPAVQTKLRTELLAFPLPTASTGNEPLSHATLAALNALPLLDAVVRETLRLHAPVPSTFRSSRADDVVPLAAPMVGADGVSRDELRIPKGTMMEIPIAMVNRSKAIWGEDAHEFNPDRWLNIPESASAFPGVWSHMLSFLHGPHACIGFRFALYEMKIILAVLLSSFTFELGVDPAKIIKKAMIVSRPVILGEEAKGNQLPLLVALVREEGAEE